MPSIGYDRREYNAECDHVYSVLHDAVERDEYEACLEWRRDIMVCPDCQGCYMRSEHGTHECEFDDDDPPCHEYDPPLL